MAKEFGPGILLNTTDTFIPLLGFNKKDYSTLLNDLSVRAQVMFGGVIDLTPTSPFYHIYDRLAESHSELWDALEDIYYSTSIDTAVGSDLDNLGVSVGMPRYRPAKACGKVIITRYRDETTGLFYRFDRDTGFLIQPPSYVFYEHPMPYEIPKKTVCEHELYEEALKYAEYFENPLPEQIIQDVPIYHKQDTSISYSLNKPAIITNSFNKSPFMVEASICANEAGPQANISQFFQQTFEFPGAINKIIYNSLNHNITPITYVFQGGVGEDELIVGITTILLTVVRSDLSVGDLLITNCWHWYDISEDIKGNGNPDLTQIPNDFIDIQILIKKLQNRNSIDPDTGEYIPSSPVEVVEQEFRKYLQKNDTRYWVNGQVLSDGRIVGVPDKNGNVIKEGKRVSKYRDEETGLLIQDPLENVIIRWKEPDNYNTYSIDFRNSSIEDPSVWWIPDPCNERHGLFLYFRPTQDGQMDYLVFRSLINTSMQYSSTVHVFPVVYVGFASTKDVFYNYKNENNLDYTTNASYNIRGFIGKNHRGNSGGDIDVLPSLKILPARGDKDYATLYTKPILTTFSNSYENIGYILHKEDIVTGKNFESDSEYRIRLHTTQYINTATNPSITHHVSAIPGVISALSYDTLLNPLNLNSNGFKVKIRTENNDRVYKEDELNTNLSKKINDLVSVIKPAGVNYMYDYGIGFGVRVKVIVVGANYPVSYIELGIRKALREYFKSLRECIPLEYGKVIDIITNVIGVARINDLIIFSGDILNIEDNPMPIASVSDRKYIFNRFRERCFGPGIYVPCDSYVFFDESEVIVANYPITEIVVLGKRIAAPGCSICDECDPRRYNLPDRPPECPPCDECPPECNERVNFSWEKTGKCLPLLITFTDLSVGRPKPQSWKWTFYDTEGDILEISTEQNPEFTYNEDGIYRVTLRVKYEDCVGTISKDIIIDEPECTLDGLLVCVDIEDVTNRIAEAYYLDDELGKINVITALTSENVTIKIPNYIDLDKVFVKIDTSLNNKINLHTYVNAERIDIYKKELIYPSFTLEYFQPLNEFKFSDGSLSTTVDVIERPYVIRYKLRDWNDDGSLECLECKVCNECNELVNFSGYPRTGCYTLDVQFTDLSTNKPTYWEWDFGDGSPILYGKNKAIHQNPRHVYTNSTTSTKKYTVILRTIGVDDSNETCEGIEKKEFYITIDPQPCESETEHDLLCCINTLNTAYTIDYITYEKDSGVKSVPVTSPTNMSVKLSHIFDVKYIEVGVMITDTKQFTLNTNINNKQVNNITDKTTGTSGIFKIRYEQPGNVIKRTLLNGSIDTLNLIEIPYTLLYDFRNEIEGLAPVAGFTANTTNGNTPLTVQFTDNSTNNPTSWIWSFGDGTTSTDKDPIHTYTTTGMYTVTLIATNSYGSSEEKILTNYISTLCPIPVAGFIGSPTNGNAPLTVQFTDQSTNTPTSWMWKFGDGGTSTLKNPSHTYNTISTYTVSLIAINSCGSSIEKIMPNYITTSALPPNKNFSYTGSYQINNEDSTYSYLYLKTSGTLTMKTPMTVDVFLCGGGGAGSQGCIHDYMNSGGAGGAGGGGGYTRNEYNVPLTTTPISCVIGNGGLHVEYLLSLNHQYVEGGNGESTKFGSIEVSGGIGGARGGNDAPVTLPITDPATSNIRGQAGGNGGSGGGAAGGFQATTQVGYDGGSDGNHGYPFVLTGIYKLGGRGQGPTTKPFEDSSFQPYGAGGAGGSIRMSSGGTGGNYGGGNGGGDVTAATPGLPNTGAGGAGGCATATKDDVLRYGSDGGSGVIILRSLIRFDAE